ncbi:hypothetical protein SMSP2_01633 [Limihaloglobus sulfuriphilus]|uniref:Uncharacterized protein n=1 Tax=Limihaloglobus sulfuriphilus TaxID=1851148 RepID=A0A1Q2MEY4_9BACT|nr:hypothetical protein [Limihaloglobus sulfuriphilus]AQQ71263.1 hypothetical protein SMSP2_01633 [Limihaloglobus sulfuriphilus]
MKQYTLIRFIFGIAAIYDGILGAVFLVSPLWIFDRFDVTPPNHTGYVQFPALLLIIFAVMFASIALNPNANKNLILYGILLKLSYCGVVFGYWFTAGVPVIWKPFAIFDLLFMVIFIFAWSELKHSKK